MARFKIGDKAVVAFVDSHDMHEGIRVGETVIIAEDDNTMPWCIRENGKRYPLYSYQLNPAEDYKKDAGVPKTETQPLTVNASIGAELTHITIGGKRFRLVPED